MHYQPRILQSLLAKGGRRKAVESLRMDEMEMVLAAVETVFYE